MTLPFQWRSFVLAGLALLPVACDRAQGDQDAETAPPFVLSPQEIQLARSLAETGLDIIVEPRHPLERICFIKVDLLPASQAQTEQRLVMVHHYRYRDDVTLLTMVDLNRAEVVKVESLAHYPTGMCPEEVARAERLAREDGRVMALIKARTALVAFEPRPLQVSDRADARFGHRLVHLLLRSEGNYLTGPRVLVDLTTETVVFEK